LPKSQTPGLRANTLSNRILFPAFRKIKPTTVDMYRHRILFEAVFIYFIVAK